MAVLARKTGLATHSLGAAAARWSNEAVGQTPACKPDPGWPWVNQQLRPEGKGAELSLSVCIRLTGPMLSMFLSEVCNEV